MDLFTAIEVNAVTEDCPLDLPWIYPCRKLLKYSGVLVKWSDQILVPCYVDSNCCTEWFPYSCTMVFTWYSKAGVPKKGGQLELLFQTWGGLNWIEKSGPRKWSWFQPRPDRFVLDPRIAYCGLVPRYFREYHIITTVLLLHESQ